MSEVELATENTGTIQNYSSFTGGSYEERVTAFNALSNALSIGDNLGKTINVQNIIVQSVDMENDQGEINAQPRVTLIDDQGTAYFATSTGVFDGVNMLRAIFGEPHTWESPIPVYVDEVRTAKGRRVFVLRVDTKPGQ